jgi:hypothetical protein
MCGSVTLVFEKTPMNSPTAPTTIAEIMADPKFELGVADVRAGRERSPSYENWPGDAQWN